MKYKKDGKMEIDYGRIKSKKEERPKLENGTVVFCRGNVGAHSFIGMVYGNGNVLELENGSNAYINSDDYLHLGDTISYWTIEKVLKTKLIVEGVIEELKY